MRWSEVAKSGIPTSECEAYGVTPKVAGNQMIATGSPDVGLQTDENAAYGAAQRSTSHQPDPDDGAYEVIPG